MSAETGVGPAIASPSHACNGNCADLPVAASNNISPIAVNAVSLAPPTFSSMPWNETAPKFAKAIITAIESPKSPTRFATKAFLAAVAYSGF